MTLRDRSIPSWTRAAAIVTLMIAISGCTSSIVLKQVVDVSSPDTSAYVARPPGDVRDASVTRAGRRLEVAEFPLKLRAGDEIETGANSAVVLGVEPGNVVLLPKTRVRIGSLELLFGRVFGRLRHRFALFSESVVASVEGTEFIVEVREHGVASVDDHRPKFEVSVIEGSVRCLPAVRTATSWPETFVHAGESFSQIPGSPAEKKRYDDSAVNAVRAQAVAAIEATTNR